MAMIGALSLLWIVEALHHPPTWKGYLVAGLLLSAGLLTKLSGLSLVALFGLAIVWISWRQRSWRRFFTAGLIVYGLALVLAGWWYVRNQVLYGDPLGWGLFLSSQRHMVRTGLYRWGDFLDFVGQVQRTYWGAFGYMHITLPSWVYNSFWAVAGLACVGVVIPLVRQRRSITLRSTRVMMWLSLLIAFSLWFASFVRFSIATVGAGHARYLFPVSAAVSLLIAVGLSQLSPRKWDRVLPLGLSSVLLVYALITPWVIIRPLYPSPQPATSAELETMTPTDIDFGGALRLIGYHIDPVNVPAGRDFQLTLYWAAQGTNRPDLFSEITVVDPANNLIGRSRRWPAENGTSIRVWPADVIYSDTRVIRVADAAPPGAATIRVAIKDGARDGPVVSASDVGHAGLTLIDFATLALAPAKTGQWSCGR